MKVNEVLRKGETYLRVLVIRDQSCFCINCNAGYMPVWMPSSELEAYTLDAAPAVDTDLTARQKRTAHERYTLIAPILAFLTDDAERNRMLNKISEDHDVSKQTLRRYLCRYLVYQDIAALAPVERERQEELTKDQKNMSWALNKYFYSPKKSKLTDVYVKLLKEKYCDAEGNLPANYPSMRQFRYFESKYRKQENYLIMIGFFPSIYPDELLYSQLCRYYQRSGYTKYLFAVDDLFLRRTAHDKAVEAVSEVVTEETRNSDFGIIMDFQDHDVDADRRLSDKAKSVVKHVLGDLMEKFRGMTRGITAKLDRMLHDPEIKERQMKPIREAARKSLLADLRAKKVEADQLNRSRRSKMTRSLEAER